MAEKKQVTAQVPEKKDAQGKVIQKAMGPLTVEVNFPTTLAEAGKMFGEEATLSNAFANWRVVVQGNIRGALKRGEAPKDIQARLATAVMGVAATGGKIDPESAFLAKFQNSTPEEQAKMIEKLRAGAAKK